MIELQPQTLLRDTESGEVYSFRHLTLETAAICERTEEWAAEEVMRQVRDGDLTVVPSDTDTEIQTCRGCGCTDDYACTGGCSWKFTDTCSSCWNAKAPA